MGQELDYSSTVSFFFSRPSQPWLDSPVCTIARILRSDFDLVSLKPIFSSPISRLHVQFQLITSIFATMPNSRLLRTYASGHCIMVHTCVIS